MKSGTFPTDYESYEQLLVNCLLFMDVFEVYDTCEKTLNKSWTPTVLLTSRQSI